LIKALKIVGWALPTLQLLNLFFKTYSNRIPYDTPRGNKFNKEYEVYSQQFLRENFGEEESFNPEVLPSAYLTNPNETHTFVYVSTIQRMTINLFGKGTGVEWETGI
jgi:type I restriction enzyme R subunit